MKVLLQPSAITTSTSSGTPTYQWERSDDNGANYAPVGGATNSIIYNATLVYADDDNDRYRCVVSLVGSWLTITSNCSINCSTCYHYSDHQPSETSVIEGRLQLSLLLH